MSAKRFKLTKVAKILILVLILAIAGGGIAVGMKTGVIKNGGDSDKPVSSGSAKNDETIDISLDEWVGWSSIILANGGLTTQEGSIYDNLGLDVNIKIINDADQSSNALIKGSLDGAGYTINRTAFLSEKFDKAGTDVVMPFFTNYSSGGDGIIATDKFKTVESLVDAKIGVPQFSEAHSLVVWFVNNSDLTDKQKDQIIDNLIFFDTPDDAAKAFFAGKIDVAATWQPYLTQAQNTSNCHVLFSTASSKNMIMDGILFREDFASKNPELITKFIDGTIQGIELYGKESDAVREVMPMFNGMSDADIKEMCADAEMANWNENKEILNETAPSVFTDMCEVWNSIGEKTNSDLVETLFDDSYLDALADKYEFNEVKKENNNVKVTEDNEMDIKNSVALLKKSATVNFVANTAKFLDNAEASKALDEFVKIAKTLDGSIIQIEGNIASDNDDASGVTLSHQRAETVKQYFVINGIDADRIITVGNGGTKPVAPNDSEANMQMNRRTDVCFKLVE